MYVLRLALTISQLLYFELFQKIEPMVILFNLISETGIQSCVYVC